MSLDTMSQNKIAPTNEDGRSPTESATINSFPSRPIVPTELSANNEVADTSDGREKPTSLDDSLLAWLQLKGTPRSAQSVDPFGDRERTEKWYNKAVKGLEEALKLHRDNWEFFELPDFSDISEDDPLPQLRQEIKKILDVRESSIKDRSFWSKGKHAMERAFISMSPFAKNVLSIAKGGSSVFIYPIHH